MNKEAFKQRIQSLKSYREQNPGKGYWDFKSYEEGGEVPPTNKPTIIEPIPYKGKLYSDRYGRKYTEEQVYDYYNNSTDEIDRFTGGPLVRGLKPLLDLEDAANFTPVGDAVAAYDVYDAVSNRDWSGAGLAALGLVPFMPMTVKQFRSKYKGITPKTKSKGGYGHNFNTSYADIINAYNDDPTKLPKLAEINDTLSSATGTMYKDMDNNGEFYYGINPKRTKLGNYLTEHEWRHYTDMLKDGHISRRGQAVSPKMMKKVIEEVSNIDSMREVARASRQFNNINKYTRWFNDIPLLGLGAAAMYNNNQKE